MTTWRPPKVPKRIDRLPKDRTGRPVPFVAPWDEKGVEHEQVIRTKKYGLLLNCTCVIGQGKPILGVLCPDRQRKAMIQNLCQICGEKIEGQRRIFVGDYRGEGAEADKFQEPPMHEECARYSLLACPALQRKLDGVAVHVADKVDHCEWRNNMLGNPNAIGLFPVGAVTAEMYGVLNFYVATLIDPLVVPARQWLQETENVSNGSEVQ